MGITDGRRHRAARDTAEACAESEVSPCIEEARIEFSIITLTSASSTLSADTTSPRVETPAADLANPPLRSPPPVAKATEDMPMPERFPPRIAEHDEARLAGLPHAEAEVGGGEAHRTDDAESEVAGKGKSSAGDQSTSRWFLKRLEEKSMAEDLRQIAKNIMVNPLGLSVTTTGCRLLPCHRRRRCRSLELQTFQHLRHRKARPSGLLR